MRKTHGMSASKTYQSWRCMRQRCELKSHDKYKKYGGIGIRVCDRWMSFENFLSDMGERPPGTSLERIDNRGNYEPGNCRWATPKEQAANRGTNVVITYDGKSRCVTEWAEIFGVSARALFHRVSKGYPVDRVMDVSGLRRVGEVDEYDDRKQCPSCSHKFIQRRKIRKAGKIAESKCPNCGRYFRAVADQYFGANNVL